MVRIHFSIRLYYEIANGGCDFIFNVHAAHTLNQTVVEEKLETSQEAQSEIFIDPSSGNRYLRLRGREGPLSIDYSAVVDLDHFIAQPDTVREIPVAQLPSSVLSFIYPSRYCESDRLHKFAMREFGHISHGHSRVIAICNWVNSRIRFSSSSSNASTSAVDTLLEELGVCRDFAHLMIALCRALNIPARFVTGIDYGSDPIYGPTDFHAYVEVYLENRWFIFDPSGMAIPMGFVRLGTGRDAADVPFATMFGTALTYAPAISIEAMNDSGFEIPYRRYEALSTDAEL